MKIKVPTFSKEKGFTTSERVSGIMRKIKSTETKQEVIFRKALWAKGLRYRINHKKLPGKPDIVIKSKMLVIFIDGAFWHGYNWKENKAKIKANRDYWIPKIERNMQRDKENNAALKLLGYTVIRFWEKEVKKDINKCIDKILLISYN